ncbi:FAD-dependent oxidoreductase, partial [Candidatus Bipolaricaulota bacterium]|nr:FAD-dependent oxidoreductase [Candidatus Bipolaricaulota bacterium]
MSYDVVVIGAGSVGTPAAFYLAREGLKVLVIDRLPSPGQGSNKAAIGGVRATHSDPAKIRLGLRTIEILSHFEEEFGYDVEWRPGGYVFVAYREEEERTLKDLVAQQRSVGLNIRWCDAEE